MEMSGLGLIARRRAFSALKEGLRHSSRNWRMLENFLYVSMDLGEYSQAVMNLQTLLDLEGEVGYESKLDSEIVEMLCRVTVTHVKGMTSLW